MKSTRVKALGLLTASVLALGFTGAFISTALAISGCDQDANADQTVTCKDTTNGDITTGEGNDSVSVDNSDVGSISTGNGDDSVTSTGTALNNDFIYTDDPSGFSTIGNVDVGAGNNTVSVENTIVGDSSLNPGTIFGNDTTFGGPGIYGGDGNNSVDISHSLVGITSLGDGNNTINIDNGTLSGVTTLGDGNNVVTVNHESVTFGVVTGDGNNMVAVDNTSGTIFVSTGAGNDTIDTNSATAYLQAGNGDDNVTINGNGFFYIIPVSSLDGGDGHDVLTFKFTVDTQKDKDNFRSQYTMGDASSGVLYFGGHYYAWQNFEELFFLLSVAHATGHDDVSVSVLKDSRLNNADFAAPIAVYCKAGQVEGWVIDPATGNGNQQFAAPISAFPTSANGVDGTISGDQAVISYAGYSYSFPAALCP